MGKIILTTICIMTLIIIIIISECLSSTPPDTPGNEIDDNQTETRNYQGVELTPIDQQQTRDIKGIPNINIDSYRLQIN